MASLEPSGNYATAFYITVGTSEETAHTVTDSSILIQQISSTDDGGVARTITITATQKVAGTAYTLIYQGAIPANDALDLEFKPLVLSIGGTIKVTTSAAGVHVMVSYVIQNRRTT